MRRSSSLLLLALAAMLAAPTHAGSKRTEDVELLIITSASNRGEVDPCG